MPMKGWLLIGILVGLLTGAVTKTPLLVAVALACIVLLLNVPRWAAMVMAIVVFVVALNSPVLGPTLKELGDQGEKQVNVVTNNVPN